MPSDITHLLSTLHSLPSTEQTLQTAQQAAGGPRAWEASKAGYVQWAVNKVLERTRAGEEGVATSLERAEKIASRAEMREALEVTTGKPAHEGMGRGDAEDRMEE